MKRKLQRSLFAIYIIRNFISLITDMTNHKFLFHTIGHHQREISFLVRYFIYTIYIYASELNVLTKFIYNMSFYSLICSNTCQRKELADNQKKYKSPHIHSFKILCLYV